MATERDQDEQNLRMDEMTINIEKLRADMKWESRKFLLQALATAATCLIAGAGLATLFLHLAGKI